jgi:hypothetical protein
MSQIGWFRGVAEADLLSGLGAGGVSRLPLPAPRDRSHDDPDPKPEDDQASDHRGAEPRARICRSPARPQFLEGGGEG